MPAGQDEMDRRSFLKGLTALGASAAINSIPTDLVAEANAQERTQEQAYEKQEPKIPPSEEIDKMLRAYVDEMDKGNVQSIAVIENKIFGGGDTLAGARAFEAFDGGIQLNINILRNRAKVYNLDTSKLDKVYDTSLALRSLAVEAHIAFMRQIPEYVFVLSGSRQLDTKSNAARLHGEALKLARANDALVQIRDEIRKIMPSRN